MTSTLTRDEVNDTGEIRHERGQTTQRLKPYTDLPVMRRPDSTYETPTIDADFTTAPAEPPKLPPPPPPKVDDRPLSVGEEIIWVATPNAYVGRHRKADDMPATVPAGRFGGLRSVLATAWARVWAAK